MGKDKGTSKGRDRDASKDWELLTPPHLKEQGERIVLLELSEHQSHGRGTTNKSCSYRGKQPLFKPQQMRRE